jgi:hypothetical protein
MATELQKQVAAFKKKQVSSQSLQHGVPSLFLSPKEAAGVDVSTVLEAAVKGLNDLSQYEQRFAPYQQSLFHSSAANVQRELKTKEVRFMHLLSKSKLTACHRKMQSWIKKSTVY